MILSRSLPSNFRAIDSAALPLGHLITGTISRLTADTFSDQDRKQRRRYKVCQLFNHFFSRFGVVKDMVGIRTLQGKEIIFQTNKVEILIINLRHQIGIGSSF
jgi:hypothetical protein